MLYRITYRTPENAADRRSEFCRAEFVQIEDAAVLPDGLAAYLLGEWDRAFAPDSVHVEPVLDVTPEELQRAGVTVRTWQPVR